MIKCTMLLQLNTTPADLGVASGRIAGWSESWYYDGTVAAAKTNFELLCRHRAGGLPTSAAVIGQRYQTIGGGSVTHNVRSPGNSGVTNDAPQMGVLCKMPGSGVANIRRMTFRGIPDAWITGGELNGAAGFNAWFNLMARRIAGDGWRFRGRDLARPTARIASIAARVLTLTDALAFGVGDYLQLRDVRTTTGRSVSGLYQVEATTGATNATLRGFPATSTVELNGFASLNVIIYPTFAAAGEMQVVRSVVKKVGRPFDQYRGRSSRRS